MNAQEQRIREFAYEIWQSEGCPNGEDARHWEMARKLVEAEDGIPTAKPVRTRKTTTKPTVAAPADKTDGTAKASRAAPKGDTDAEAGTPRAIKKSRAPRTKKA